MDKERHFKLVVTSLRRDPNSWVSDYNQMGTKTYTLTNKKLDCSIWVSNGLLFMSVQYINSTTPIYHVNFFKQIYLYFLWIKWKNNKRNKMVELNINIDEKYETYLNRYDAINELLK